MRGKRGQELSRLERGGRGQEEDGKKDRRSRERGQEKVKK